MNLSINLLLDIDFVLVPCLWEVKDYYSYNCFYINLESEVFLFCKMSFIP